MPGLKSKTPAYIKSEDGGGRAAAVVTRRHAAAFEDQKWYLNPSIIWRGPIFVLVIWPNAVDPNWLLGSPKMGLLRTFWASIRISKRCPFKAEISLLTTASKIWMPGPR